jgi:hypothetical protein
VADHVELGRQAVEQVRDLPRPRVRAGADAEASADDGFEDRRREALRIMRAPDQPWNHPTPELRQGPLPGVLNQTDMQASALDYVIELLLAAPAKDSGGWLDHLAVGFTSLALAHDHLSHAVNAYRDARAKVPCLAQPKSSPKRLAEMLPILTSEELKLPMICAAQGVRAPFIGERRGVWSNVAQGTDEAVDLMRADAYKMVLNGQLMPLAAKDVLGLLGSDSGETAAEFVGLVERDCIHMSPHFGIGKTDQATGKAKPDKVRTISHNSKATATAAGDLESVNSGTDKDGVPDVALPQPRDFARKIIFAKLEAPEAVIGLGARDANGAFYRVQVGSRDVALFATRSCAYLVFVYLVLTMGWTGSPGFYGAVVSHLVDVFHGRHRPVNPDWHGSTFRSITFVDDSLFAHADVGLGLFLSQCCLRYALTRAAGEGAWNTEKDLPDDFTTLLLALGFYFDSEREELTATPARLIKAYRILMDPAFATGNYLITLHAVQVLYGNLRFLATTCRSMLTVISAIRWFMTTGDAEGVYAEPSGSPALKQYKYEQLWLAREFCLVLVEDIRNFRTPVIQTCLGSFSPFERLSLPGQASMAVMLGSDASPDALFVANWKLKEAIYFEWTPSRAQRLRRFLEQSGVPPEDMPDTIIAVLELIPPVLGFAHWGRGCTGSLFIAAIDNMNAVSWVNNRTTLVLAALHMLHLLGRDELLYSAELVALHVPTKVNKHCDEGSRPRGLSPDGARTPLAKERASLAAYLAGHVHADFQLLPQEVGDVLFDHHLGSMASHNLSFPWESAGCLAARVAADRQRAEAWTAALRLDAGEVVLCLSAWAGAYGAAAQRVGAGTVVLVEPDGLLRDLLSIRFGAAIVVATVNEVPEEVLARVTLITASAPCRPFHVQAYPGRADDVAWLRSALVEAVSRAPEASRVVADLHVDSAVVEPGEMALLTEAEPASSAPWAFESHQWEFPLWADAASAAQATGRLPEPGPAPAAWGRVGSGKRKRFVTDLFSPAEIGLQQDAVGHLTQRSVAAGTLVQYDLGMRHFDNYVVRRGGTPGFLDPRLYGDAAIETLLIEFVAYNVVVLGYKASTVESYLYAVRYWHLHNGLPNPIADKPRLALVRRGAKRYSGCSKPKVAVTPDMLKHVRRTLDLESPQGALMWAALLLGFFYLLRCSEYLHCPGRPEDNKVLLIDDLLFALDGADLPFERRWEANRCNVHLRFAKNGQMGLGADVVCWATGEGEMCPICALNNLLDHRVGAAGSEPVCMVDGHSLSRDRMVRTLKAGAVSMGAPAEDYATHSLRIGGATTMINEGWPVEVVRRHGRWMSINMWRRYTHTTNELMKGVARSMARAKYTVAQAARDFRNRLL